MNHHVNVFQLMDSALPVGGFVFSMGMESAIKSKLLQNESDLKAYLITYLEQLISFEIPFLNAAYQYANDIEEREKIVKTYKAMLMNPKLEKSSLVLGKNWLRFLSTIYESKMKDFKNSLDGQKLELHYTLVFGMSMRILKINENQMREMFVFAALRDQITALTRLGTVGPMGGQGLLTYLLEESVGKLKKLSMVPYYEAKKSAYVMEIIQLNHDEIYSKLFQN